MPAFVDLHCHVLPGLDDGPADVASAAALVAALERAGFAELYPTPHQKSGAWTPAPEACQAAAAALREAAAAAGMSIRIHPPAGENMWDALFLTRMEDQSYPTYPGQRAFLVELQPEAIPPRLQEHLFRLRIAGQLPVLAHVERYEALLREEGKLRALGQSAALLVNLPALGGSGGWLARRRVRKLVRAGLVHAAATDSHSIEDVPYISSGISWIRGALGDEKLRSLLEENPRRILAGELPEW